MLFSTAAVRCSTWGAPFGASWATAFGIHSSGQLVGYAGNAQGKVAAAAGVPNNLVAATYAAGAGDYAYLGLLPGGYESLARAINSLGHVTGWGTANGQYIVGWGSDASGRNGAFLLTAVLPGDANGDDKVNVNDLTIVLTNHGQSGMVWNNGDFNNDGKVDVNDLTIVLTDYGKSVGACGVGVASVPEPSTIAILLAGAAGLLGFAWRSRKPSTT